MSFGGSGVGCGQAIKESAAREREQTNNKQTALHCSISFRAWSFNVSHMTIARLGQN